MRTRLIVILLLVTLLNLLVAAAVSAQSGSGFDLHVNVLAAGGGKMTGDGYTLTGTLGQTAIGPTAAGVARLNEGYWYRVLAKMVVLPLVFKH